MHVFSRLQMVKRTCRENGFGLQNQAAATDATTDNECDNVWEGLYPHYAIRRWEEFVLSAASTSIKRFLCSTEKPNNFNPGPAEPGYALPLHTV